MDDREVRLRIVESLIPVASRVEIRGELLVIRCKELEEYVSGNIKRVNTPDRKKGNAG